MRLPFRRTQRPATPRVYEPGADSPYVPREGVWMASTIDRDWPYWTCCICGQGGITHRVFTGERVLKFVHESCGAKLVAQLRRERESA